MKSADFKDRQVSGNGFTITCHYLAGITRPTGGGVTSYDYGDDAGNLYVPTVSDLDVVNNVTRRTEDYQYFDGLGRTTRAFANDGTSGTPWIVSDTHYDGASRILSVSNPYRVVSVGNTVPACGTCTTTVYDIIGRVQTVTLPDGSMTTTDYSNNTVTATDPAGKKRSATSDGLGRMLTVVENPGASPSYITTYLYDLLNNLRKVTQGTQTRFFYCDAISRLRREKNPEHDPNTNLTAFEDPVTHNTAWSVEYTYDLNGNLIKKTDPRNISVNIGYDRLNRPITRTYTGDSTTPPVDYLYDGARVSGGITNSKGRMTGVLTSSAFVSNYTYDSFDDMGRVLHD
jgi:YD repeat-containing protein